MRILARFGLASIAICLYAVLPAVKTFADNTPSVAINVQNAVPRQVEDTTERAVARDYAAAWQAMIKALEAFPSTGIILSAEGWLFRIAHNAALDFLRRRARRVAQSAGLLARAGSGAAPGAGLAVSIAAVTVIPPAVRPWWRRRGGRRAGRGRWRCAPPRPVLAWQPTRPGAR